MTPSTIHVNASVLSGCPFAGQYQGLTGLDMGLLMRGYFGKSIRIKLFKNDHSKNIIINSNWNMIL